jgi:hypothetical protein
MLSRRRTSSRVVVSQKPNRRTSLLCTQNHKMGRAISQQRIWCLCFGIVSTPKKDRSEDSLFLQRGGRAISQQRIWYLCFGIVSTPKKVRSEDSLFPQRGGEGTSRRDQETVTHGINANPHSPPACLATPCPWPAPAGGGGGVSAHVARFCPFLNCSI